jgi:hypothetical protein
MDIKTAIPTVTMVYKLKRKEYTLYTIHNGPHETYSDPYRAAHVASMLVISSTHRRMTIAAIEISIEL